jgi:bifunctional DNA-binding transcriptional regulator/antitoxin component of YhaV-PrlF toxin-antitoxin module
LRAKLEVGSEGRIVVPPRQAEALGLAGGGEVDFVSARGACALLVPARSEASPSPWFAGSLGALTVPEVVHFVFQSLKTGVLLLSFGDGESPPAEAPEQLRRKSIYFRDGQVVFASSSEPRDRLGSILAATGMVASEDLERCTPLVRAGRPLGQVLVDEGVLTAVQLYEAVGAQVKEIFLGCFLEAAGEFAFLEGAADGQGQVVKLPERTRELILQGMKRLEEAELRRAEADAGAAAAEIVIETELAAVTPPPGAPAREKVPRAAGPFETYRRIFRRVHEALAAVEPDAAARLNSWLDRLPETRRGIFEGVRLGADGELDVAAVLMNVNVGGTHRGAAARARALEALEEFLSFALFEAKNRLPRPDADRLLREVGKMQVGKA